MMLAETVLFTEPYTKNAGGRMQDPPAPRRGRVLFVLRRKAVRERSPCGHGAAGLRSAQVEIEAAEALHARGQGAADQGQRIGKQGTRVA